VSWIYKKLSEICELNIGKTPSRSDKSYWVNDGNGGEVWLSIADITKCKSLEIFDSKEKITNKGASLFKKVKTGTLMMSFKLSIGKLAIAGRDLYTNEAIVALPIKNKNEVDIKFLYYFLSFYDWDKESENDVKVKGKTLNKAKLKEILVPIPSLATQQMIVAKLDAIFAEIDKAVLATESNVKNANSLFKNFLNNLFEQEQDSQVITTLGQYYDVRDGTHDSPKFHETGYPLITSKNLRSGEINFDNVQYVSKDDYLAISKRSGVNKGDVLMAMIGTIGNPVVVEADIEFAIKNVALLKTNNQQSPHFLRYYLCSDYVIKKMEKDAKGTTQKFVGLGYLRSFPIKAPSLNIQLEIVKELDNYKAITDKVLHSYVLKVNNLNHLKNSILQQAFNGELVKD
jgi:type I restriction enzyme S subunit